MAARQQATPLILTKLHRPPSVADLVQRERLYAALEQSVYEPLTLVSAPAGYGKTTLVSHWIETREGPSAWLSVDETDGDIRTFLRYFVAVVQNEFPESCPVTLAQLEADVLPPMPVLAGYLINDLDNLEESLVLVLDDYHRIMGPAQKSWRCPVRAPVPGINTAFDAMVEKPITVRRPRLQEDCRRGGHSPEAGE